MRILSLLVQCFFCMVQKIHWVVRIGMRFLVHLGWCKTSVVMDNGTLCHVGCLDSTPNIKETRSEWLSFVSLVLIAF